jgi:hypothetical protein
MPDLQSANAQSGDEWLSSLFDSIDRKDAAAFIALLEDNCRFRFGNMPEVTGRQAIAEAVGAFFSSIAGLSHQVCAAWQSGDWLTCHGLVTYQRHDGSTLSVPFANLMKRSPATGQAVEYLIFADISALYVAA